MTLAMPKRLNVLLWAIVTGTIIVAGLAGVLSYQTLITWARPEYGPFAPLFAAIIDVGTIVFALATFYKVIKRHPKWGVRIATHTTAGLSILFNALGGTGLSSAMKHAAAPLILIMAVETLLGIVWRRQQEIAPQLDRIRISRWLLAPISTASIWRRMVLWELRSYNSAMEIDRERVKSRIKMMQQSSTRFWFRVPRDKRTELKLRLLELARSHADAVPASPPPTVPASRPRPTEPAQPEPQPVPRTERPAAPVRAAKRPKITDDQIRAALDEMYDADPRDVNRKYKTIDDIRSALGVRKARVSGVNRQRREALEASNRVVDNA